MQRIILPLIACVLIEKPGLFVMLSYRNSKLYGEHVRGFGGGQDKRLTRRAMRGRNGTCRRGLMASFTTEQLASEMTSKVGVQTFDRVSRYESWWTPRIVRPADGAAGLVVRCDRPEQGRRWE